MEKKVYYYTVTLGGSYNMLLKRFINYIDAPIVAMVIRNWKLTALPISVIDGNPKYIDKRVAVDMRELKELLPYVRLDKDFWECESAATMYLPDIEITSWYSLWTADGCTRKFFRIASVTPYMRGHINAINVVKFLNEEFPILEAKLSRNTGIFSIICKGPYRDYEMDLFICKFDMQDGMFELELVKRKYERPRCYHDPVYNQ